MAGESVVLHGEILADGSLRVPEPVALPPGQVEVTVKRLEPTTNRPGIFDLLPEIRARQEAAGFQPRSAEEVDRYVRELRDEWHDREASIEAAHEQSRRGGAQQSGSTETPP